MRSHTALSILIALAAGACSSGSNDRQFTVQGQVVAVAPSRQEATIKHEEIKGLMPAMTMSYKVKDAKLLDGVAPGDLITATLVVLPNDAYLTTLKKVGQAPLEKPPADVPSASSGFELLKPGDAVPDTTFVDQDGKTRDFGSFKGQTVVLTFIYTRCPMPTYCPLMDRHFATIQRKLKSDPALAAMKRRVHLVSVSFDPVTDTPPVLETHARALEADPKTWTFLTGDRDEIDRFASRFGVSVARALDDPRNITHNLRTAIVGPDGKLLKIYTGNEWTPDQVLADLK